MKASMPLIHVTRILLLLFVGQLPANVYAQDSDESIPLRTSFGISGNIGVRLSAPEPVVHNTGRVVIAYKGKPERSGWCGCTYYALNDQGTIEEVKFDEYNADVQLRYGLFRRNGNGWLINGGYHFSRYSYSYKNIPFMFKGYRLESRNSDLESHGILLGLAKYWNPGLFVRLNGLYHTGYTTGAFNKPVDSAYKLNFTENGTGFLVTAADQASSRFSIVPEVGLTSKKYPMEFSIAVELPVSRYAMTEQYAYYTNQRLTGVATASYSTMNVVLNLRLVGFTLFETRHRGRPVRQRAKPAQRATDPASPRTYSDPSYPQPLPTPTNPQPSAHQHEPATQVPYSGRSRFDNVAVRKPIRLQVNFDQSADELLADSFADLDALAQWLNANPTAEIRLEGHTDLIGEAKENLELSRRRVVAVKDYLSRKGIASYRVEAAWFGASRPLSRNCPPPAYCPENRRVEMVIRKR
ncbi:OmpA family protein [Fibrella forsythiae]|uniref:OmpA family protein n=1 Tax=Fibrella forsythiae TaxID=2817061 RepID=A0ABS3JLL8_9BACT|nr:OmpA family protein [Fibrella forsythiae]MBO0950903.1 OmpA family protein [Fibrella forsythiae]